MLAVVAVVVANQQELYEVQQHLVSNNKLHVAKMTSQFLDPPTYRGIIESE
jgi:hypothetical protein